MRAGSSNAPAEIRRPPAFGIISIVCGESLTSKDVKYRLGLFSLEVGYDLNDVSGFIRGNVPERRR